MSAAPHLAAGLAPTRLKSNTISTLNARKQATRLNKTAIVVALAVAGFVWNLSLRQPFGPSAGTLNVATLAPSIAADQPARLRVGTYNIHGGKGTDGVRDLDRIAAAMPGLDFVGLNEVHGAAPWDDEDQATTLGRTMGMTPLFAPTEDRWRCIEFGNGLLTRVSVERWQVVPLERRYAKSHRNLIHVRARAANGVIVNLVVTHLVRSEERERREQLATVGNYFLSLAEPAILLGDLNSDANDEAFQFVLQTPGVKDALRERMKDDTPRHIDWVLVRGAAVTDAGLVKAGPSDHPHVWAELSVPAETESKRRNE